MLLNSTKIKLITREINPKAYEQTNLSLNPIIRKIYASRGVIGKKTNHSLQFLIPPSTIKGIKKAAKILLNTIIKQQQICIVGDYDVDGATSTAIMVDSLTKLGAKISFVVPNRENDGYGLTPKVVAKVLAHIPNCELIITVDNGTSSIEGVSYAKSKNIRVIITDHHLASDHLPDAEAIVNPNMTKDHPLKNLSGVGVSFYFLCYLVGFIKKYKQSERENKKNGDANLFQSIQVESIHLKEYLDLVALGTVADCVSLDYNNRILVLNGLEMIRKKPRIGVKALIDSLKRLKLKDLTSVDISFYLAPILNSAGRLEDMSTGVQCLLSKDINKAQKLAHQLVNLNIKRKEIQRKMQQSANELLKNINLEGNYAGYCFYHPSWHEGVSGILASKIKEQLLKPVIVFTNSKEENILKGSGRSVNFLDIKDVLDKVSNKNPNLIKSYGGHAMAAGLQIKKQDLASFSQSFEETIQKHLREKKNETSKTIIYSDGELVTKEITIKLAKELKYMLCWGSRLEYPLFHGSFFIQGKQIVAENHIKLRVYLAKEDKIIFPAISFNSVDEFNKIGEVGEKVIFCYHIELNTYNNTLQLNIRYFIKDE